jgi:hypothetical protein
MAIFGPPWPCVRVVAAHAWAEHIHTVWLGAQNRTTEVRPFLCRICTKFLLHFDSERIFLLLSVSIT